MRPARGMSNYGGSIDRGSLNNQTLQTHGGFISQTAEHFSRLTNDCSSPYYVRNDRIPSPESKQNENGDTSPKVEVMSYHELQYNNEQTENYGLPYPASDRVTSPTIKTTIQATVRDRPVESDTNVIERRDICSDSVDGAANSWERMK